ncbi:enoyl-CoA hydratase/isomerase family protein [Oxalobacteraceae bacterium OM1]|nr:enoyl-CoA hydratase/isomerase family protein [Oxalobacteraceae bacterium OM1]
MTAATTEFVRTSVKNRIGFIALDRPKALNSLSLDMVRAITAALLQWQDDVEVRAIVIHSTSERAFCAGGDIRFFHDAGTRTPQGGSALLEDFFTEEYALNHLIHFYPKPYIALMDGVVMGGGMGVAQGGEGNRMRVVTERTKMAMPEVNIGLFPDVGGGYFLSRVPGAVGTYLGVTGETIGAADAIYAGLADVFVPGAQLPALLELLGTTDAADVRDAVRQFAAPFAGQAVPEDSPLAIERTCIDQHFAHDSVRAIEASLAGDDSEFAAKTLAIMEKRSPLMMCVTFAQLRRGAKLGVADCLRLERTMVRRCFEHGEVLEGVRSLVIDKDNAPRWNPASLEAVTTEMVEGFFAPAWPMHAHPLRHLA